jgi:hypothetical protein
MAMDGRYVDPMAGGYRVAMGSNNIAPGGAAAFSNMITK